MLSRKERNQFIAKLTLLGFNKVKFYERDYEDWQYHDAIFNQTRVEVRVHVTEPHPTQYRYLGQEVEWFEMPDLNSVDVTEEAEEEQLTLF
jgi:hypothetical protein